MLFTEKRVRTTVRGSLSSMSIRRGSTGKHDYEKESSSSNGSSVVGVEMVVNPLKKLTNVAEEEVDKVTNNTLRFQQRGIGRRRRAKTESAKFITISTRRKSQALTFNDVLLRGEQIKSLSQKLKDAQDSTLVDLGMSNFKCRICESNDKFDILKFESGKPGWYILVSKENSIAEGNFVFFNYVLLLILWRRAAAVHCCCTQAKGRGFARFG